MSRYGQVTKLATALADVVGEAQAQRSDERAPAAEPRQETATAADSNPVSARWRRPEYSSSDSFGAKLEARKARSPFPNDWPSGYCVRCHEESHACWTCHDAGRVRIAVAVGQPGFGRSDICPDCVGSRSGFPGAATIDLERELVRMRTPAKYRDRTIASWLPFDARPRAVAETFVQSYPPPKPLIFLTGGVGTGKTHMACGIVRAFFERHGKRGQFWPTIDLLDRYRATFDESRATETVEAVDAQLRQCAVLVLDDYGAHRSTEWAEERLFRVVDERYRTQSPLVITSNIDVMEMPARVLSRLKEASESTIVYFDGPDQRPMQGRKAS